MKFSYLAILAVPLAICSCTTTTSGSGGEDVGAIISEDAGGVLVEGRELYLRGEMNGYEAKESYRLKKAGDGWCATAALKAEKGSYKFKFGDNLWTSGSNFGFAKSPGEVKSAADKIELNRYSKFEDLKYIMEGGDGNYDFCLLQEADKFYVTVKPAS